MPNRTGIRRGFTRLTPILTVAAVRSKAGRSALLCLLVLSVSGCGDNGSVTPTPLGPTPLGPTPPPGPRVTVRLEGRVLDEQNQPVAGARITNLPHLNLDGTAPSTTADDAGGFSLTVDWLAQWLTTPVPVVYRVDREGYEGIDASVPSTDATTREVLINMYRLLTISPGESIEGAVSLDFPRYRCGGWWETYPCRRVLVNAPSGELVDLDVFPADGQKEVGLARRESEFESVVDLPSRMTVAGGDEVWIVVGELGRVKLRAASR
jgi:hypothetical protein